MIRSILFLLFCTLSLEGAVPHKPYIVLTIPKSGTHMIAKLLREMTGKPLIFLGQNFDEIGIDSQRFAPHGASAVAKIQSIMEDPSALSVVTHFNFDYLVEPYATEKYAKVVFIRDLRDVCVSAVYFVHAALDNLLTPKASFDERLGYIIEANSPWLLDNVFNVKKEANEALYWMQRDDVLVMRFEELVGENGGGTREQQLSSVRRLADHLEISMTEQEIDALADRVWGPTPTFRKGQIGSWQEHFKNQHKRQFKRVLGEELIRLGYESDYDW